MARATLLIAGLCLAGAGCVRASPPAELQGLWSAGPAACAAGIGIRFGGHAIQMVFEDKGEALFARPRYQIMSRAEPFRVRITYDLPLVAGGAREPGARGVFVLTQQAGGGIAMESHNLVDPRTGAVRARIADDPAATLLALEPCGEHPWREGLRGLSAS